MTDKGTNADKADWLLPVLGWLKNREVIMRVRLLCLLCVAAVLFTAGLAAGGQKEDAVDLVKQGAAYIKANGAEKAVQEFNDKNGKFVKGDLYIFALDMKGIVLAHPINPKLIGKDMLVIKDADGKFFAKDFVNVATNPGKGWVHYKWTNPTTKKIEPKSSFIERVGAMLIGCGIYR